ncbi:MAG: HIT family protein [Flavobacteriales bacterium]|nr:HIT family protein [Flavobacteriales bacterium]
MSGIFSKIVAGDLPAFKVAEDESHLAFLDINPLAYGHVLVIPKKETDYIFDIIASEYVQLLSFAQQVAKAMDQVIICKRIGMAVIGLEVPHAHIHLVPLDHVSDINFDRPKLSFTYDEMRDVATKIRAAI